MRIIPSGSGCVKQTIITPTITVIMMNKTNVPTFLSAGCVDHHEYSLIKYLDDVISKENKHTKVLVALDLSWLGEFVLNFDVVDF